ncbi:MAG: hypothetical protein M9913_21685 [Bryobacteraceae bacterium]|nr:hypothetical protein [Solibacteraceae bacterium]MCO5353452.1 hypothetical protein [Bryobacteraceae bacterium]
MIDAWPLLPALALGGAAAEAALPAPATFTPPLRWLWRTALAVPFAFGITSITTFALIRTGTASPLSILAVELALLATAAFILFRRKPSAPAPTPEHTPAFSWNWALRIAAALATLLFLFNFQAATIAAPFGEWDASFIWNLRARFLAGGDAWLHAVQPGLNAQFTGASHPDYPLLLSAFIARGWILSSAVNPTLPSASGLAASLATLLVLFTSLAWRRAESLGLLALLVLLASEGWISQTPSQQADVPLSLLLLAASALLHAALDSGWSPRLALTAGLLAGFAAWIKNEGIVFLLALLALTLWRAGPRIFLLTATAALPGALATLSVKILAQGSVSSLPTSTSAAVALLANPARWAEVLSGYAGAIASLGFPITHPLLLLALLAFVLRPGNPERRRLALLAALPALTLLVASATVLVLTTANLQWHIGTTVNRLLAQVWPTFVFAALLALRAPEELALTDPKSKPPTPAAPPDPAPPPTRRPRPRPRSG